MPKYSSHPKRPLNSVSNPRKSHKKTQNGPSTDMDAFRQVLRSSKNIIAITGAGLSAASGIPTFRGQGGIWRTHDAMTLATPEAFEENPTRSWRFYQHRRATALAATPNAAHEALALFSLASLRHAGSSFTHVTQNVDDLCPRALHSVVEKHPTQEISELIEMHGRLFDVRCTSSACNHSAFDRSPIICPALANVDDPVMNDTYDDSILIETMLPRCSRCGSLARPGDVWFGENPMHREKIETLVNAADLCLVIGTSSTVRPACEYQKWVKEHGGKVAVFNLKRSSGDSKADFRFIGRCEQTLPKALGVDGS